MGNELPTYNYSGSDFSKVRVADLKCFSVIGAAPLNPNNKSPTENDADVAGLEESEDETDILGLEREWDNT